VDVSAVTDAVALKATVAKLGPSLAGTGGRLAVDAHDLSAVAGAAPSHLGIVVFDDVSSAQGCQSSAAFEILVEDFGSEGTLSVFASGGIADPGALPSFTAESLGAAPSGRNAHRLPDIQKIADICKGRWRPCPRMTCAAFSSIGAINSLQSSCAHP
jgi:uncharacterized protein (DUF1330 family)